MTVAEKKEICKFYMNDCAYCPHSKFVPRNSEPYRRCLVDMEEPLDSYIDIEEIEDD